MRDKIDRGGPIVIGAVIVACVFGGLVWGTFGRDHTKTVVQTKTRTVVVTKRVGAPAFDGKPQTLANFTNPDAANQLAKCPAGIAHATCYVFQTDKWFILYAVPQ